MEKTETVKHVICDNKLCKKEILKDEIHESWIRISNLAIGGKDIYYESKDFCCTSCLFEHISELKKEIDCLLM